MKYSAKYSAKQRVNARQFQSQDSHSPADDKGCLRPGLEGSLVSSHGRHGVRVSEGVSQRRESLAQYDDRRELD